MESGQGSWKLCVVAGDHLSSLCRFWNVVPRHCPVTGESVPQERQKCSFFARGTHSKLRPEPVTVMPSRPPSDRKVQKMIFLPILGLNSVPIKTINKISCRCAVPATLLPILSLTATFAAYGYGYSVLDGKIPLPLTLLQQKPVQK